MTLLLRMVAGSRLYGTNRPDSDFDWYEVHDKCKPFHSAHGPSGDLTRWNLSQWLRIADKGGHNALDLMFAPADWPEVDRMADFRASYLADPVKCWWRFQSTIETFESQKTTKGDLHAQRIRANLEDIMKTGRYDPRWRR